MQETQETRVRSLGWKDHLEEEMATHSMGLPTLSIQGKSYGQKSLIGYILGLQRVGHD